MAFRFEDRGVTLRLFVSESGSRAHPATRESARYAMGWIAKDDVGRWVDDAGVLPPDWTPAPELLNPNDQLDTEAGFLPTHSIRAILAAHKVG